MNYAELIVKALKGRSVNSMAKQWQVPQRNLDRYVKAETLPNYETVLKMIKEAGVAAEDALKAIAEEEVRQKRKIRYNTDRADVAQSVEQLIRNQ